MNINKVLLLGPTPPPHGGIATYCKDIFNSYLKDKFKMVFFDVSIPESYRPTFNTNNKITNIIFRDGILNTAKQLIFAFLNFVEFYKCICYNKFTSIVEFVIGF